VIAALTGLTIFTGVMCHQVILTAPPNSQITVFANPEFIPSNGGISLISALVTRPDGIPVADGTVVQFFTNLGRIDPQGRTNDGIAHVNLVADARSGTACVIAVSGGPSSGGGGSGSPSPTPTPTTSAGGSSTATDVVVAAAATTGECKNVTIGNLNATRVVVTAFPQHLTDRRASLITANVFDANGNPVANAPVIFQVDVGETGDTLTEFMDSQGTPTFTDNNGQAQDVMRTRYPQGAPPKTAVVFVEIPPKPLSPGDAVRIFIN
jgi:hypothetical protein